jgi:hypothetical protein
MAYFMTWHLGKASVHDSCGENLHGSKPPNAAFGRFHVLCLNVFHYVTIEHMGMGVTDQVTWV